jgi:hypothetical protein
VKKYGSVIMLAVVIVLAILFWTTSKEPLKEVKTPYSIPAVENVARVELTTPGEDGGLVVLQKAEDGWALTKPVEAPVAEGVATALNEELGEKINTDDIKLKKDDLSEYGLDEDHRLKIALYPEGAQSPAAEFHLGKTIAVPGTRAKRTYILGSDDKVYRAHTNLGQTLNRDVSDLRSKKIQTMDRQALSEVTVTYEDGQAVKVAKKEDTWKLVDPEVDYDLEKAQINALIRNLSSLTASSFADDTKPAAAGLEPPHATIVSKAGDDSRTLEISKMDPEKETFHIRPKGSEHIYIVAETTGNALTPTPISLRKRLVHEIDKESVTRIEFGGDDRIVVQKKDGEWSFVRGAKGSLKTSALDSRLNSLAKLRAIRFEDVPLEEAGLDRPNEKVTFVTTDGSYTLLFGKEADHKGNLYAKWSDTDLVMVVSQWVRDRSTPTPDDLTADES